MPTNNEQRFQLKFRFMGNEANLYDNLSWNLSGNTVLSLIILAIVVVFVEDSRSLSTQKNSEVPCAHLLEIANRWNPSQNWWSEIARREQSFSADQFFLSRPTAQRINIQKNLILRPLLHQMTDQKSGFLKLISNKLLVNL